MSVNCEPSELTPLRRSHLRRQTAAAAEQQQQQQHQQQFQNYQEPTTSSDYVSMSTDYNTNRNTNNTNNNNNNNNNTSDSDLSDLNRFNIDAMGDTTRIVTRVTIDIIVLSIVGIPILAFFVWGDPYKRGFFCDDESLMHPFKESTVRNWMLYIIGMILPICLISATEIIQAKSNKVHTKVKLQVFGYNLPTWVMNAYKQIIVFGFGAAVSQLTTDIAKYSIGRLRPHFFSVCQPIMPDGTNCSHPSNIGRYIEEFKCIGSGSSSRMLKEVSLSFPSGHSSFSAYTMIYCAIYLQSRMTWRGSRLLKHFLQYVLIMLTWYTCLSRISDYKHHWSDVMIGAILGAICALIVANFVADLGRNRNQQTSIVTPRYEMNSHNSNNGTIPV